MNRAPILILSAALANHAPALADPAPAQSVSVSQLLESPADWDGKYIQVTGFLPRSCDDFEGNCHLTSDRNGKGDAVFFRPSDEDRKALRKLIGKRVRVNGCFEGCLDAGLKRSEDGSQTLSLCLEHIDEAELVS